MCRVTMAHLRVTIGHLRVTVGHHRVGVGHLLNVHYRSSIYHYRVDEGHLEAHATSHLNVPILLVALGSVNVTF